MPWNKQSFPIKENYAIIKSEWIYALLVFYELNEMPMSAYNNIAVSFSPSPTLIIILLYVFCIIATISDFYFGVTLLIIAELAFIRLLNNFSNISSSS